MHSGTIPVRSAIRRDVYGRSLLVSKTAETGFWSVLDLDGTFAEGDMGARRRVRRILEEKGVLVFSTARTPELVMSGGAYDRSAEAGFLRGRPNCQIGETGLCTHAPLESLDYFTHCLDPDAILGFGEAVCIAQAAPEDGEGKTYLLDEDYEQAYLDKNVFSGAATKPWRELAMELVREIGCEAFLSCLDREGAYEAGEANVEPLKYRIQLDFFGADAVERKYAVLAAVEKAAAPALRGRVEGVDESKPSKNLGENRTSLYLMPPGARKENMLNRALAMAAAHGRIDPGDIKMLIAGDTLTDFYAGCYGGIDAEVTFILVGGSRLTECIEEKANFAGVDLRYMHRGLKPTNREGVYWFDNPLLRGGYVKKPHTRRVILGDKAYPGTIGAETILAYLEDPSMRALNHV